MIYISYSPSFEDLFDVANMIPAASKIDIYEFDRKGGWERLIYGSWLAQGSSRTSGLRGGFYE